MRGRLAPIFLAVLLAPAAAGQDDQIKQRRDRLALFNACRPMGLVVEPLRNDAADIGLTTDALQATAESRLRAALLYTEDPEMADFAHLYVNVHVIGLAFNIRLEYRKRVVDVFGQSGPAATWILGFGGTHGRTVASVTLSSLSQMLRFP